jgi:hypothetical protein
MKDDPARVARNYGSEFQEPYSDGACLSFRRFRSFEAQRSQPFHQRAGAGRQQRSELIGPPVPAAGSIAEEPQLPPSKAA